MLAGHFGVGLAIKSRYRSVALLAILLAAELPDLLFVFFHAIGWESMSGPPAHPLRPDTFGSMAFSHDVSMVLIYACLAAAIGLLLWSVDWALALGLAVVSHIGLDLLVHAPDIGVGGPWLPIRAGGDLWRRALWAAWGLEMVLVVWGGWSYLRARLPQREGRLRARAVVGLPLIVHLASLAVW
ncbi:MAG: hypothetical protein ACE5G2_07630 [Candidatus Krumholzibacteriia bacterium]